MTCSDNGRALPCLPVECDFQSREVGVGNIRTAPSRFVPCPRSVTARLVLFDPPAPVVNVGRKSRKCPLGDELPRRTWIRSPLPPRSAIVAVGVGRNRTAVEREGLPPANAFTPLASAAIAVGKYPNSPPPMGCAGMGSTHHERPAGVTERFQIAENPVSAASSESRDVLSNDPTGSALGNKSAHLAPEAGTLAFEASALTRRADVLTREAAADGVRPNKSVCRHAGGGEGSHVIVARHLRPMFRQHGARVWLALAESDGSEAAGPLEAEAEPANAAEQVEQG